MLSTRNVNLITALRHTVLQIINQKLNFPSNLINGDTFWSRTGGHMRVSKILKQYL